MDRRNLAADLNVLVSPTLEERGFLAVFTERTGGASSPPFDSLNLGPNTGDGEASIERNHRTVAEALGVEPLTVVRQVHGRRVIEVDGAPHDGGLRMLGEADALLTSKPRVPMAVMVADCVPLVLASESHGMLAAVHLGWRGISAGLIQRAMAPFVGKGEVVAAIGPSIGPCHYEVGEEVLEAVAEGTGGLVMADESGSRPRLDLGGTVEGVLRERGVASVERAPECTACEPSRFFSHRRDGTTGRQAMVAMRL